MTLYKHHTVIVLNNNQWSLCIGLCHTPSHLTCLFPCCLTEGLWTLYQSSAVALQIFVWYIYQIQFLQEVSYIKLKFSCHTSSIGKTNTYLKRLQATGPLLGSMRTRQRCMQRKMWMKLVLDWGCLQANHWPDLHSRWTCLHQHKI